MRTASILEQAQLKLTEDALAATSEFDQRVHRLAAKHLAKIIDATSPADATVGLIYLVTRTLEHEDATAGLVDAA